MKRERPVKIREAALPWSDGTLSAQMWMSGRRAVVGVPELGLHCYGSTQSEASFRLFACLIKYYRQLKTHKNKLGARGLEHLRLLSNWIQAVERRMATWETVAARRPGCISFR